MWQEPETLTAVPAIPFLRTWTYRHLEPALWDGNLRFYGSLEKELGDYGRSRHGRLFIDEGDSGANGIALVQDSTIRWALAAVQSADRNGDGI